ncbi:MAG: SsrA-binding protein SmpB [Firmicutes bacterium]|nr:SsrA-binding protein SmpB [Bacillota bacterium]
MQGKLIANNKKAAHDFFFLEKYEAGIVLSGTEIKSIRAGGANLRDSFARIDKGELWVYNMNISPYDKGNRYNTDPMRPKKLLLHKKELRKLTGAVTQQGLTIVPVQLYITPKGKAKLEIAVAKGKKLYDKREDIAARDAKRNIERNFKDRAQ